jgi:SAM-dependent methyltransferase
MAYGTGEAGKPVASILARAYRLGRMMDKTLYDLDAWQTDRHWWHVGRRRILSKILARFLPGKDRNILEVGCGTGGNLAMLSRFGRVEGIEAHGPGVAIARARNPGLSVREGGLPDLLEKKYDTICLFDVLEHIDDDADAIAWIEHHLTPGGWAMLTVPAYQWLWTRHDELSHHKRRYTRSSLISLLAKNFDVAYSTYFNTHLFLAILIVILGGRLFGRDSGAIHATVASFGWTNAVLTNVFAAERMWLPTLSLPFGISIFVAARVKVKRSVI